MPAPNPPQARRLAPHADAARYFQIHPRTLARWLSLGFVVGYADGAKRLFFDLDEVEQALRTNPHMRDGRRSRFGPSARIEPLPSRSVHAEVVSSEGRDR